MKVQVTKRAIVQRIRRSLAKEGNMLRTSRSEGVRQDLGEYYVVDTFRNRVIERDVDLERLARDIGALEPYECIAAD